MHIGGLYDYNDMIYSRFILSDLTILYLLFSEMKYIVKSIVCFHFDRKLTIVFFWYILVHSFQNRKAGGVTVLAAGNM